MAEEAKYVEDIINQEDNFSHWYNQVVRKAELAVKEETKATLRVIPFDQPEGGVQGKCIYSGKPATCEAIFARAY
jgi:prolyl-tRNA synthetase